MTTIPVPDKVSELVQAFEAADPNYIRNLNEFTTRTRFIDPLFEALGWNVTRARGADQLYDEVVFEDTFRLDDSLADVSSVGKRPDYSFRLDGERKFYVEAKKPAEPLDSNRAHAFQVRAYGWSARLPVSILTDFEEFSVYDCRVRPDHDDQPSTARLPNFYIRYNQYADRWADIAELLHRDAVAAGSLDRFVETVRPPRGTQTVDAAFLKDISMWREVLARDIAARNPDLGQRDLNYAVQMTINRIIFLRICEDRGIEPRETLKGTLLRPYNATEGYIYRELVRLFDKADQRYNSGLFHFHHERNRSEHPDDLTPNLFVSDDTLANIIGHLYYPYPYKFDVIPVEILGQVYEQFLGKVIVRAPGGDVTVEEKPEVRKAGGVYYTPAYIVDYIVEHTVGKLLEGKTPEQAAQLRILDPACGSGSFLIGAYSYLLDWHLRYYLDHDPERLAGSRRRERPIEEVPRPASAPKRSDGAAERRYRLTVEERKRILLNNVYGVDIDSQAVEVTKLSLLLKVLEGEREGELQATLQFDPHARVLPDLGDNIKCGNSLIGWDFGVMSGLTETEQRRINPFDWGKAFPSVMQAGGFDAVIGNPPYIRIQAMKEWAPIEVELYKQRYIAATKGNYDIYVVFVEKGLSLLNENGRLGFILPHKFFNAQYGEPLRGLIAQGKHLEHVVHFGAQQVFSGATTYTCLFFLNKQGCEQIGFVQVDDLGAWRAIGHAKTGVIPAERIIKAEWNLNVGVGAALFEKLHAVQPTLGDVAEIFVGLQTSADDVFIMDYLRQEQDYICLQSKALKKTWCFETRFLFPLVSGTDVKRYRPLPSRQYILFPYVVEGTRVDIVPFEMLINHYPRTAQYLQENKNRLEKRERGRLMGGNWHGYIYLKNMTRQSIPKLCIPRLVDKLYAAHDVTGEHFLDNVDVGGITFRDAYQAYSMNFLLGLLNSRLLGWYFPFVSAPFRGGWLSANRQFVSQLPIRTIDPTNPADKARHDRMVHLVERMLALHRQLAEARTPHDKTFLQAQIDATDREIDRLVYDLYSLTEEEIAIVEGRSQ